MERDQGTASDVRACFYANYWAGSVQIRGVEVASARSNWTFARRLTDDLIRQHDVFCVVKKPDPPLMAHLRDLGKTVVYDTVDPWKQPEDGLACRSLDDIQAYFAAFLRDVPADGVIFANRTMAEDLGRYAANPTYIYHHFRPTLAPAPLRERAEIVGYHGVAAYLGEWGEILPRVCAELGLVFRAVPGEPFDEGDLRSFDIGIVARGGAHGCLMARRYKSNVKLANLYGAAIPCVVMDGEQSSRETAVPEVGFFSSPEGLKTALEALRSYRARMDARNAFLRVREEFTLGCIAGQYEAYFRSLLRGSDEGARQGSARCSR